MSTFITILAIVVILFIAFKVFKLITRILLIVFFLGIAWLTNPSIKKHEAAVMKRAQEKDLQTSTADVVVKNLQVASVTQIQTTDHDTKAIGIGLFTQVFIFRDPK